MMAKLGWKRPLAAYRKGGGGGGGDWAETWSKKKKMEKKSVEIAFGGFIVWELKSRFLEVLVLSIYEFREREREMTNMFWRERDDNHVLINLLQRDITTDLIEAWTTGEINYGIVI